MTNYTDALQADNLSTRIAAHLKDPTGRWSIECWPTSEGVDVIAVRPYKTGPGAVEGMADMHPLGTVLLCDRARELVRGL